MININNINTTIKTFLETESGGIFAMQEFNDRATPVLPYFTFGILNIKKIGRNNISLPINNDGDINIKGDKEFSLRIMFYGDSIHNDVVIFLDSIIDKLLLERNKTLFRENLFIYVQPLNSVLNVSISQECSIEKRSSVDLLFRVPFNLIDNVSTIENVGINYTVKTENEIKLTGDILI